MNFIATIIQLRARGMSWMRLPFFVWAQFVTGFLLLLAFPPLEAAEEGGVEDCWRCRRSLSGQGHRRDGDVPGEAEDS